MTIEDARKLLPSSFTLARNKVTVDFQENGRSFGEFDSFRNKITVFVTCKDDDGETVDLTKEQVINTFWHETAHALQWFYSSEMTEQFAQSFGNLLSDLDSTKQYE